MKPKKVRTTITNNKFGIQHNSFDVIFSRLQISFSLETEKAAFAKTITRVELNIIIRIKIPAVPSVPISAPKRFGVKERAMRVVY